MSSFEYQVIKPSDGQILRPNGLSVMLLSYVVKSLLSQHAKSVKLGESDGKDMGFDYFTAAKKAVQGIKHTINDKTTEDQVSAAVGEINTAMGTVKSKIESLDSKLIIMSDLDEMWFFLKEVALTCVDSLEVIENFPSDPNDNDGTQAQHRTKVQIIHDGNNWVYDLQAHSGKALETTLSINNLKNPKICQNSVWINAIFKMMAIMAQKDLIENNFVEQFNQEPDVVKKAKATASILGGNYKDYLIFVANINSNIPYLGRTDEMQKKGISLIFDDRLRATQEQKKEVVKIFLAKPNYH